MSATLLALTNMNTVCVTRRRRATQSVTEMPVNTDEIVKFCAELSQAEDLQVTIKESAKGACIVGGSAFAGGVIGGPVGLAVGGMFGSLVALAHGKGKYRAAADVILHDMTPTQHARLAASVHAIVADLRVEDVTLLLPLVLGDAGLKQLVIREVITFFRNEMSLSIQS